MFDPPFLFILYKLRVMFFFLKIAKITTNINLQHGILQGGNIILCEYIVLSDSAQASRCKSRRSIPWLGSFNTVTMLHLAYASIYSMNCSENVSFLKRY